MRMYVLRAGSGMGRLTRRAYPHSVNTLRLNVPMDSLSTPYVPTTVSGWDRQGGWNFKNN